jgi:hypothetical protein
VLTSKCQTSSILGAKNQSRSKILLSIVKQRTRGKSRGWGLVFRVVQVRRSRNGKRTASEYHDFNVSLDALRLAFTTSGMMYSCNSLSRAPVEKLGLCIFMFRRARAVSCSSNYDAMLNVINEATTRQDFQISCALRAAWQSCVGSGSSP